MRLAAQPCSTLVTIGSGFLFGFGLGYVTAISGALAGGIIAFILAKYRFGAKVHEKINKINYFRVCACARRVPLTRRQVINESLASNSGFFNALKMVILARLPPLFPYPVINYAFGLTKVRRMCLPAA